MKHFPFFDYMYVPRLLRSLPASVTGLGHPSEPIAESRHR
jgi:hypothetical protein